MFSSEAVEFSSEYVYRGFKYKVSSAVDLAVLISSGSATTVSQKSKDASGNYDGDWTAKTLKASSVRRKLSTAEAVRL